MTGMLWYSKQDIREAVKSGVDHYEDKYGKKPNFCHVNPLALQGAITLSGIDLKPDKMIMKDYYWIGIAE